MKKSSKRKVVKLSKFDKKSFTLLIGDEGAVLTYVIGKKLQARMFASLDSEADLQKFRSLLSSDSKAPISILVDVADQTYTHQSLPAVSSFSINKLVKKRLDRDFAATDLKGSILIGRSKTGRNDWNFLFISAPFTPPLSDWFKFIINEPNPFRALYLLPVETENILNELNKVFFPQDKKKKITKGDKENNWQLFISHNKVGGFRQVAFKNGKIAFTRQISVSSEESSNFIAGTVEQEILNSFEYLKRLSLKDTDNLDIFILVSKEIKNSLLKIKIKGNNVIILTPYEASVKLGYQDTVGDEDKYGDVLLSVIFASNKPFLPFVPASIKRLSFLEKFNRFIRMPLYIAVPASIIYLCILQYNLFSIKREISKSDVIRKTVQERYDLVKKSAGNIEDATKINDVVSLYKLLSGNDVSPLSIISDFSNAKSDNVLVKSINWKLENSKIGFGTGDEPPGGANMPTALPTAPQAGEDNSSDRTVTTLELEFYNNNSGYQELFNDFDNFVKNLEAIFSNYHIEYSRLTDKISFNEMNKVIPVQVTITGPKSNKGN